MRVSRIAPIVALACAAASGVVAVLSSRASDWRSPAVLAVLLAFAFVADRVEIGLAVRAASAAVPDQRSPWFALLVAGAYLLAWSLNVCLVVGYMRALRGRDVRVQILSIWRPMFWTQLAT